MYKFRALETSSPPLSSLPPPQRCHRCSGQLNVIKTDLIQRFTISGMSSAKLSIRTNLQSPSSRRTKSPESIYVNNGGEFVYGQNVIREDLSGLVVDELKRAVRDALEPPSPIGIRATRTVIIRMNMEEEDTAKQPTVPKPYGAPPVASAASVATAPVRRHSRSKDDYRCIPVMTSLEENTNSLATDSRRERIGAAPPLPQASMSVRIAIGYGREF